MITISTFKSKYGGRDLVPVLIVGGLYGVVFALVVREVVSNWRRAETADLINQALNIGTECARKDRAHAKKEKEKGDKEGHRKKSSTKGRRHNAKKTG